MPAEVNGRLSYRFGSFEVLPDSLELRKGGVRLKLREQSFRILVTLLERPGELITRENLRRQLWAEDTFVDFDKSLNTAVNKLREVLCDSATEPHFIETTPRHGYRFIAEVEKRVRAEESSPATAEPGSPVAANLKVPVQPVNAKPAKQSQLWLAVRISACLLIVGGIVWFWLARPAPAPRLANSVRLTSDSKPKLGLLTDGTRLYYTSPALPNLTDWRVFQVSAKGGEASPLPGTMHNTCPLDISRDGSELLARSTAGWDGPDGWKNPSALWIQPVMGASPRRLGELIAQDAAWSPDGSKIVYARGHSIAIAKADGSRLRTLATLGGSPFGLRWSPDGRIIRFTLRYGVAEQLTALWQVSLADGRANVLFPKLTSLQSDGAWTPDGKYYVFSAVGNGTSYIYALPERHGLFLGAEPQPVRLTTGPMQTYLPTPSPDGKRLFLYGFLQRGEILQYDAKSSRFLPFLPGLSARDLSFTRDGKWMTYISYPERTVWRSAADGTQRLQLSPPSMIVDLPRISPDGGRIAFVGGFTTGTLGIYVVPFDGGAPHRIVESGPKGIFEATWSPDGNTLVLGAESAKLYVFDLRTNRLSAMPGSEGLWSPRWSPDGRYIAALGSPVWRVMLLDLKTHKKRVLADLSAAYPSWSHDSQFVYFRSGSSDEAEYRARVRDGKVERVASLKDVAALVAPPGRGGAQLAVSGWAGLTPTDCLLVTREVGNLEIYSMDWVRP